MVAATEGREYETLDSRLDFFWKCHNFVQFKAEIHVDIEDKVIGIPFPIKISGLTKDGDGVGQTRFVTVAVTRCTHQHTDRPLREEEERKKQ